MGTCYTIDMQVIARRTLKLFWEAYPAAAAPLQVWYARVNEAAWNGPADVKTMFGSTVDFVGDTESFSILAATNIA
jgi:mRNA interferase HigB